MAPPVTDVDLLGVARRVAGDARPGEQIEAYVLRSRDVDVKVFGGEVESLAVAEVEGVGVRVIVDARQGYAWAGSLDADVVGLMEIENSAALGDPVDTAVSTLVGALNAADPAAHWAFVPSSTELPAVNLQDAITNALKRPKEKQ